MKTTRTHTRPVSIATIAIWIACASVWVALLVLIRGAS
jgi:hypothetical protein